MSLRGVILSSKYTKSVWQPGSMRTWWVGAKRSPKSPNRDEGKGRGIKVECAVLNFS